MRILFFGAGKMGELARNVIESIEGVELFVGGDQNIGKFDLVFSASYPGRISQETCALASLGGVNIHTGLLPEGRGSNPLNWALIWGKEKTGITIHKIVDTYDAGDVCLQEEVPIFNTDTIVELRERVESVFPKLVAIFLSDPAKFIREAKQQNQALASYAQKRRPEDSELNLNASPLEVYNLFRSCDPLEYPAFAFTGGQRRLVTHVTPPWETTDGSALVWYGPGLCTRVGKPYED